MQLTNFHFKGLDSLRGIAAISVIIGHIELIKRSYQIPNFLDERFFKFNPGHTGVILFFVLSGFLITLLLLKEKSENGKINIKNFYVRRILRVWPLYYLILALSPLLIDFSPSLLNILLCVTIFPNIAYSTAIGSWGASPQIWSIGVEEQFYLFWPVIIQYFRKKLALFFIVLFVLWTLLPHFLLFILVRIYPDQEIMNWVNQFFYITKFNCMALGGLAAYIYYKKLKILKFLSIYTVSLISIVTPFVLWILGIRISYFTDEVFAVIFSILILCVVIETKFSSLFNFRPLRFLGKISYGLYMFHWIVAQLVIKNFSYHSDNILFSNFILYAMIISITVVVSIASYYLFEMKFLKLKEKFKTIA